MAVDEHSTRRVTRPASDVAVGSTIQHKGEPHRVETNMRTSSASRAMKLTRLSDGTEDFWIGKPTAKHSVIEAGQPA